MEKPFILLSILLLLSLIIPATFALSDNAVCSFVNTTAESLKSNSTSWSLESGNISWGVLIINVTAGDISWWSCAEPPENMTGEEAIPNLPAQDGPDLIELLFRYWGMAAVMFLILAIIIKKR